MTSSNKQSAKDSSAILIVDDNSTNRKVLKLILRDFYSNVDVAGDGKECLQKLSTHHFDLILLDLNMPKVSGFEVLNDIKNEPGLHRPAVIVVSSDTKPDTISRAFNLGASDYVSTPFNRDELLARVSTHLQLHSRELTLEARVDQRTAELQASNEALKETQNQLIMKEKMASLGELSAGVAHEINNPIGYIKSNMESLKHYVTDLLELIENYKKSFSSIEDQQLQQQIKQQAKQYEDAINLDFVTSDISQLINDSINGAHRVKQIVGDLKTFSHPGQSNWKAMDMTECINSVLNIVHSETKYKADIELIIEPNLPMIECIGSQIYQVLTNLLINAAHAIETHGTITINAKALAESIQVSITDNGIGMNQVTQKNIFVPFFTTKTVGEGTGLGLSVSYGIIEAHNGTIKVESALGKGTMFTITLPITQTSPTTENQKTL